ncbi:MAG: hypothetical protein U1F43_21520 [Myxococcota bacterium]
MAQAGGGADPQATPVLRQRERRHLEVLAARDQGRRRGFASRAADAPQAALAARVQLAAGADRERQHRARGGAERDGFGLIVGHVHEAANGAEPEAAGRVVDAGDDRRRQRHVAARAAGEDVERRVVVARHPHRAVATDADVGRVHRGAAACVEHAEGSLGDPHQALRLGAGEDLLAADHDGLGTVDGPPVGQQHGLGTAARDEALQSVGGADPGGAVPVDGQRVDLGGEHQRELGAPRDDAIEAVVGAHPQHPVGADRERRCRGRQLGPELDVAVAGEAEVAARQRHRAVGQLGQARARPPIDGAGRVRGRALEALAARAHDDAFGGRDPQAAGAVDGHVDDARRGHAELGAIGADDPVLHAGEAERRAHPDAAPVSRELADVVRGQLGVGGHRVARERLAVEGEEAGVGPEVDEAVGVARHGAHGVGGQPDRAVPVLDHQLVEARRRAHRARRTRGDGEDRQAREDREDSEPAAPHGVSASARPAARPRLPPVAFEARR